jgi:chemotaxis protein histidine kinase CheA
MEENAMSKEQPIELFMPPNILKAKVGGTIAGLDMAAVKRAEQAMEELKVEFTDWITTDIGRLGEAYDAFVADRNAARAGDLFRASHDLKGQATTFEYPLIARVASSLSKLIDELASPDKIPLTLVEAHVDAIRVIFRDKIKDISDLTALTLAEELEAKVIKALAHASHKG